MWTTLGRGEGGEWVEVRGVRGREVIDGYERGQKRMTSVSIHLALGRKGGQQKKIRRSTKSCPRNVMRRKRCSMWKRRSDKVRERGRDANRQLFRWREICRTMNFTRNNKQHSSILSRLFTRFKKKIKRREKTIDRTMLLLPSLSHCPPHSNQWPFISWEQTDSHVSTRKRLREIKIKRSSKHTMSTTINNLVKIQFDLIRNVFWISYSQRRWGWGEEEEEGEEGRKSWGQNSRRRRSDRTRQTE